MKRILPALLALVCALPAAAQQPKPAAQAQKASTEELLKTADDIVKQTSALRQLSVKQPVKRGVLGREAIGEKLKAQIAKQYTPEQTRVEAKVLKALGLLPPELDWEKLQMDLLMEQVGGFYDPYTKTLYIANWLPMAVQPMTMSHEITHALQDQHYDLKRYVESGHDQNDRQLARHAIFEGDATGVMIEFTMHNDLSNMGDVAKTMELTLAAGSLGGLTGTGGMPVMQSAPEYVKQTLMFPYIGGIRFIQYVRKRYPWSKVDEIYKHLPESTEQILHPEKYFGKEHPIWIKATPLPELKPASKIHEDTVGELQMRIWLKEVAGAKNAVDAAAGRGGDRLQVYETAPDAPAEMVWLTEWDTEADAAEFAAAARPALDKLGGWSPGVKGTQFLMLFKVPADAQQKVVDDVTKNWKPTKQAPP